MAHSDLSVYDLVPDFIDAFIGDGFRKIDRNHPLVREMESITERDNQFFHMADLIEARIVWASKRSSGMIGVDPGELNAYHFMEATHPDDLEKHTLGRSKMFNLANDLFKAREGKALLSINIRIRNSRGEYPDLLFQLYFFYVAKPYNTVFLFQVHTDIASIKKKKNGYHYYAGDDFSYFRYPDEALLEVGNPLSDREFEIVRLIEKGMNSEQIAEKLFLSVSTVNTHRTNMLKKTGKAQISELIYYLKDQRMM